MRLINLIPVTGDVVTPEMIAYSRRFLHPETELVTVQIDRGPTSIVCEADMVEAAGPILQKCVEVAAAGCDGIFVSCFCDAGVRAARACVDIPVFGGFEPTMHLALGLADRVGIAILGRSGLPMIASLVRQNGLQDRVAGIPVMNDIPVEALGDRDRLHRELLGACLDSVRRDGIEAVVLGCTGMVGLTEALQQGLRSAGHDLPVIEAAQSALCTLELFARMGLRHSPLTYPKHTQRTGG